jgi:hypothetical protein
MKGQWKTIEAVMSGVVILLFVAVLTSTGAAPPHSATAQGYRALGSVYDKDAVRACAAAMDTDCLNAEVAATGYLFGYNHSVTICNATECVGSAPDKENVWASSLLMAGDESYAPVEVILYVFGN